MLLDTWLRLVKIDPGEDAFSLFPLYIRMLERSLVEVVLEKKIFKCHPCLGFLLLFCYHYLPLEKGMALHSNKLKFSSSMDALHQVWLHEISSVVLVM